MNIPSGTPSGEYLFRTEQLGLHNPYPAALPQFYISCAQIKITNGGSGSPGPLVAIPGHVKGTEAGYTVNIYNNFQSYSFLGPAVWSGGGSGPNPTTTAGPPPTTTIRPTTTFTTTPRPTTTTTAGPVTTTPSSPGGTVNKFGQCGGIGYTGPTQCVAGSTCTKGNDYYYQCL